MNTIKIQPKHLTVIIRLLMAIVEYLKEVKDESERSK